MLKFRTTGVPVCQEGSPAYSMFCSHVPIQRALGTFSHWRQKHSEVKFSHVNQNTYLENRGYSHTFPSNWCISPKALILNWQHPRGLFIQSFNKQAGNINYIQTLAVQRTRKQSLPSWAIWSMVKPNNHI